MPQEGYPLAAVIANKSNGKHVNLSVLDAHGVQRSRQSVPLLNEDEEDLPTGFARWSPYQLNAARNAQDKVSAAVAPEVRSDPSLRIRCLELAVAKAGQQEHEEDTVRAAGVFEKYILEGRT